MFLISLWSFIFVRNRELEFGQIDEPEISNMATARECIRNYVLGVKRWLESGNHDLDGFEYIVFRLDWVVSILVRYSDTEGLNVSVINVLCEARDTLIRASQCTGQVMCHLEPLEGGPLGHVWWARLEE